MEIENVFQYIKKQLEAAEAKHPVFPEDAKEGCNIITEEYLELVRAVNDGETPDRQMEEAAHVAVTAIRFIQQRIENKVIHWTVEPEEDEKEGVKK